jgi:hypothetical protein
MKIECAIVTLLQVRMVVALPDGSWVRPGAGEELMKRIAPYYPALPILLFDKGSARAYAPFESEPFRKVLDLNTIEFEVIDLDTPAYDDSELPF